MSIIRRPILSSIPEQAFCVVLVDGSRAPRVSLWCFVTVNNTVGRAAVGSSLLMATTNSWPPDPHVDFVLPGGTQAISKLRVEITNLNAGEVANIHVREVSFH
jgi:hypothetical protein